MPQIAQQDYIHIQFTTIQNPTDGEKAIISEKVKNGTIMDCLLEDMEFGRTSKVIAFDDECIAFYDLETSNIVEMQYAE